VLDVPGPVVVHVSLHPHLRPSALVVAARHVVPQVADLIDPPHVDEEQPRLLEVDERDARRPIRLDERLERHEIGLRCDDCTVADGPRDTHHLP